MKKFILLALAGMMLAACTKDRVESNGDIQTETRSISGFTGVHSSGSNQIHILYGTAFKVEVRGSSNLIPYYKTVVHGGVLDLGYQNRVSVRHDDVEVFVTMPLVDYVSLSGSGGLDISGAFPLMDRLETNISGSGDIRANDGFACNFVKVRISGSGNTNLAKVQAKDADVNISGSGEARIAVAQNLKVRISGSGNVFYTGSAAVDSEISGSGRVIRN